MIDKKKLLLFIVAIVTSIAVLWMSPSQFVFASSVTVDQIDNATVVFKGNKELFNLKLNKDTNELHFYAEYKASEVLKSYHTTGFYISNVTSKDGDTLSIADKNRYYMGVGINDEGTHEYQENYSTGLSTDDYYFTYNQLISALEYLFPGEDLTKEHTVYLHDVFIKKSRDSVDSGWEYDWEGTKYRTLDEFITMYPYYGAAKREEMSPYYNIPFTIKLSAVNVTVDYVDTARNTLKASQTVRVLKGGDTTIDIPQSLTKDGKEYKYTAYETDHGTVEEGENNLTLQNVISDSKVTLIFTNDDTIITDKGEEEEHDGDSMSATPSGPVASAVIKSDSRGAEIYDVSCGIPTTEPIYVNALTSMYLLDYKFSQISGTKIYPVTIKKNYTFINEYQVKTGKVDSNKNPIYETKISTTFKTVERTYYIKREYSYWKVDRFNLYMPEKVMISNDAMPSSVSLNPVGLSNPSFSVSVTDTNIVEPTYTEVVTLPSETLYNTYETGSIDWTDKAESIVKDIKCINDYVRFNGTIYMSNTITQKEAPRPTSLPVVGAATNENVFFKSGILIPYSKLNKVYSTTAKVTYKKIYNYGAAGTNLAKTYTIASTNSVTVHTPTVCFPSVVDASKFDQSVNVSSGLTLVLDQYFSVNLPTYGSHLNIRNYGYRDYMKYIIERQVCFPFDVYYGGTYVPGNTWVTIGDSTSFYIPTWVNEGQYTINFRSVALNANYSSLDSLSEVNANEERSKYVATDSITVRVVGRMYGFQVYDISDYPNWKSVFRASNSLNLAGITYAAGLRNRNGVLTKTNFLYTLPILKGSHPTQSNLTVGTGYAFRYYLYSIGNYADANDYVEITPRFYYVSSDGSTRTEVDVYYDQTINGKYQKMVKVGSELDKQNLQTISLGDDYMSVSEEELSNTAEYTSTTIKKLKSVVSKAYTAGEIKLSSDLRTLVGSTINLPSGISAKKAGSSVQKWYGTYYLPASVRVVSKGYDVLAYAQENNITYREDFWLGNDNGGYLVVNFDITLNNAGVPSLAYDAQRCDMWNMEGYSYQKVDSESNEFKLMEGDVMFYDLSNSVGKDYAPGGTH